MPTAALDQFFDAKATINGQTVACCLFPPSKADPLTSLSADTDITTATILIRRIGAHAWNDPSTPPRVGDTLTVPDPITRDTQTYTVTSCDMFDHNYFTLTCRLST